MFKNKNALSTTKWIKQNRLPAQKDFHKCQKTVGHAVCRLSDDAAMSIRQVFWLRWSCYRFRLPMLMHSGFFEAFTFYSGGTARDLHPFPYSCSFQKNCTPDDISYSIDFKTKNVKTYLCLN